MSTSTTAPPPAVHHYEEDTSRGGQFLGWLKQQYALYILVALLIVATITKGAVFWGGTNLTNLLLQMSIIGVVVLAELIVVLTGGIDISVGSALGLAAVIAAGLFGGPSVFLALLVAVVIGGAVGAVNGWLVAFRGLEPFIVTLGMLALARGLVYAYGNGIPITPAAAPAFAEFGQSTFLGIPVLAIIWLAMVALIAFLLYRTVWGRRVYAIGSNIEAARASGIPVKTTLWSVYILAGLLVGLGGWMFLARFASGTSTAGNLMELEAIAAVVIGGAALSGGKGKVFGAVMGTVIFAVIANLLSLLNVSTFLQDAFRGALILVAVTLATVSFTRSRARSKTETTTETGPSDDTNSTERTVNTHRTRLRRGGQTPPPAAAGRGRHPDRSRPDRLRPDLPVLRAGARPGERGQGQRGRGRGRVRAAAAAGAVLRGHGGAVEGDRRRAGLQAAVPGREQGPGHPDEPDAGDDRPGRRRAGRQRDQRQGPEADDDPDRLPDPGHLHRHLRARHRNDQRPVRQPDHRPRVREDHRETVPRRRQEDHHHGHPDRPGDRRVRRPQPATGLPRRTQGGRAAVRDQGRAGRGLPAGQGPGRGGEHARRPTPTST